MNYRFSTTFLRAMIKSSLDSSLPILRILLKATGSTVSHIASLATLQSCFYELAYTGHKVGFALVKQQHHSRQMHSKYPLVVKGTLTDQSAKPKNLGFPLSQAAGICPSSCQFQVLLPFAFLPFAHFSCLVTLLHPKLPHQWLTADSAEAALYLHFSWYPTTRLTPPSSRLCCTWLNYKHTLTSDRLAAESLGRKPKCDSLSSYFVLWALVSTHGKMSASIHGMTNRLWKTNTSPRLHSKLALFSALFSPTQEGHLMKCK